MFNDKVMKWLLVEDLNFLVSAQTRTFQNELRE